jgi:hypothetical protein
MTNASKGRIERRVAAKAQAKAATWKEGDPIKSVITLTEIPGTGGFTIGLGLHGARMEEINPGANHPVSIVDVIALAVTAIIRKQPKDFIDEVSLVNETLRNVQQRIEAGDSAEDAIAGADEALGGAINDLETASAEDEELVADVG